MIVICREARLFVRTASGSFLRPVVVPTGCGIGAPPEVQEAPIEVWIQEEKTYWAQ